MFKKIIVASIFLLAGYSSPMQQSPVTLEHRRKLRVAAFNDWKKDPEIAKRLNTDEAGSISAYIHLSMFIKQSEFFAKSPETIAEATQLAQQICPSYTFWPEYYEVYSRTKRGKCYSAEEQMELVLGPITTKITRLKMIRALLKGENPASIQLIPDWKREAEAVKSRKDDLSLISLIPLLLPPKKQELNQLKQEFDQLSDPANLRGVAIREQQKQQRIIQLEQSCTVLQRQIGVLNTSIKNNQEAQNRIASSLALLESSKTTDWEVAFVETVKAELEK